MLSKRLLGAGWVCQLYFENRLASSTESEDQVKNGASLNVVIRSLAVVSPITLCYCVNEAKC